MIHLYLYCFNISPLELNIVILLFIKFILPKLSQKIKFGFAGISFKLILFDLFIENVSIKCFQICFVFITSEKVKTITNSKTITVIIVNYIKYINLKI